MEGSKINSTVFHAGQAGTSVSAPKAQVQAEQGFNLNEKAVAALRYLKALSMKLDTAKKGDKLASLENPEFKAVLASAYKVLVNNVGIEATKGLLESSDIALNPAIKDHAKEFFVNIPEGLARPDPKLSLPDNPKERMEMIKDSDEFKAINDLANNPDLKKMDQADISPKIINPLHSLLSKGFAKEEIQDVLAHNITKEKILDGVHVEFIRIEAQERNEQLKAKEAKNTQEEVSGGPLKMILGPIKAIFNFVLGLIGMGPKK